MPDLKYLYRVLYIAFLSKLLIFFFNKAYYQESKYTWKAQQWFDTRKFQTMSNRFLSLKQ